MPVQEQSCRDRRELQTRARMRAAGTGASAGDWCRRGRAWRACGVRQAVGGRWSDLCPWTR